MKKDPAYKVTIDIRNPQTHRALVSIVATEGKFSNQLRFPVWTPGSYLVREFSRHITKFEGGIKLNKHTWIVSQNTNRVSYEVYCFERTVRTSYIDNNSLTLNGATILPLLENNFEVTILLPTDWKVLACAHPPKQKKKGQWVFTVNNDDDWIDSPILAAKLGFGGHTTFQSKHRTHHVAWVGQKPTVPISTIVKDLKKITDKTQSMFGGAPFRSYYFLLDFFSKAGGGLEHRNSQLSHFDGYELKDRKKYEQFLGLLSHEYFHAWNVKSLRPVALGPFNYFSENYTEDLWFAEGITSYFDDKIVYEAGLISKESYYSTRLRDVNILKDEMPGVRRRSLAEASFDSWIRYYRPDEDSVNSDVSYYIKGAQLGWCWDAYLQKKSKGKWSLAKLLRAFWKEFGIDDQAPLLEAKPGYTRRELFQFAENKTGISHSIVNSWVQERKALPWRDAAAYFQVHYTTKVSSYLAHFLGMQVIDREGKSFVMNIYSGSSAEAAGICVNDEVIAIENIRITTTENLQNLCEQLIIKEKLRNILVLICRGRQLFSVKITIRVHHSLGTEFMLKEKT